MTDDLATREQGTPLADERAAWLGLVVILGGSLMVSLDMTIVNVALHQIAVDLDSGSGIEWVVTAYLLAVCVSQPASGWLADRFGRKAVFQTSLVAFTVASLLCAMAPTLPFLVGARVLQGLGGGALMPVGMAMVFGMFSRERHGRAIGAWGLASMLAPAIGPTLGGWLVTTVSWHWLFLINVPLGIASFIAGIRLLPDLGDRNPRPFDGMGLLLGAVGLSLVVLGLSEGNSWGWASTSTLLCMGIGAVALCAFVVHELRTDDPLLELRMFQERTFRLAIIVLMFIYIALFARLVFLPLQLQGLRGKSALTVGLLFLPAAIVTAGAMHLGGRLVDRMGPRTPAVVGSALMFVAMLGFAQLTLTTPMVWIATIMCVQGFGFGLLTPSMVVAGISELPQRLLAQGTALRSLIGQVSGALAVAILGAVVAASTPSEPTVEQAQSAFNNAFAVSAVGVAISLLLAFRLPRHRVDHEVGELQRALVLE